MRGRAPTAPRPPGAGQDLTIRQVRVVAVQLAAHETRALGSAGRAPQLLQLQAQRRERGQYLLQAALRGLQHPRARDRAPAPAQPVQLRGRTLSRGGDGEQRPGRERQGESQAKREETWEAERQGRAR